MTFTYPDLCSAVMVCQMASDALDHISAKKAGALGGIFASGVQFWNSTLDDFVAAAFSLDFLAVKLGGAFFIGLVGYAFFGGLFAYFLQAKTQSRLAWFLAGAMVTTTGVNVIAPTIKWARRADLSLISTAHAQEQRPTFACDNILNFTVLDGLSKYFGVNPSGYRVVAGSFKRPSEAQAFANKVNVENPSIGAFVGNRAPCNDFYPVVVGETTDSLSEAKALQAKVRKLETGANAYISYRR